MGKIVFFGGMGAILNCAIALHSSPLPLNHVMNELLLQPFSAMRTLLLLPAALGFLIGTAVMLVWSFLRAMVVRALLRYDGWFLTPRNPINKVWFLLMVLLLGKKNLGSGNYQQFLPSLPVPSLRKTCKRYLDSVRPLLSEEQYQKTEQAVKLFEMKEGSRLQLYLKLRSWTHRNWINEWWEEYIYLRQRSSISFNSNYYSLGTAEVTTPHQLDRAASLMYHSVLFSAKSQKGLLHNMNAMNIVPFCAYCVKNCSLTTRIPGKEVDSYITFNMSKVRHAVVLRMGKFYSVQVLTDDGRVLPPSLIKRQLEKLVEMAGDETDETGVMTFTALPRTEWAEIRERLERDPLNRETLRMIDSSFVLILLDTEAPESFGDQARHMFHGSVFNRWFDKSVSMCVCANGTVGCLGEHSKLDATVGGQCWEYVLQREEYDENGHVLESSEEGFPFDVQPKELRWNLESFTDDLERSKVNLRDMIDDSDLIVTCPSYGKAVPKKCQLSPDGWFQMAMQLAYYRMYNCLVLTYESATTRFYYKGRTETIRPVSMKSKAFVEAMDDPNVSIEERKRLLKEAIKYQEQYKFEAMRGMGVDRHLFGLYLVAKWLKLDPMPQFFQDEAFQLKFHLSTSQTPTQLVKENWRPERRACFGGFGTVTDTGYGVSYIVFGEDIVFFSIHSKRSCPTTSSERFGEAIKTAFDDMRILYSEELAN